MWKRGGRSDALDRAQALLSARRGSRRTAENTPASTAKAPPPPGAENKSRSAPPHTRSLLSNLSDLSSVSSGSEVEALDSNAGEDHQRRDASPNKDPRPQSSLGREGGGGCRFLKRPPPSAPNSSQSPVRQPQQEPQPRCVTSSQRGSQTAALRRLAQIESRIRSRNQAQEPKAPQSLTLDRGLSPPAAPRSPGAPADLSSQTGSERGKRFLKTKPADDHSTGAPKGPDGGDRSGAGKAVMLQMKPERLVGGVSLESDEEDMRKLLGSSLDSTDTSIGRPSNVKKVDQAPSGTSQRVTSRPLPADAHPSPPPPSHRSSPFRFTGHPQVHFSPAALSLSPSPPPSLHGLSPPRSLSPLSSHGEVHSLEELFPVRLGSPSRSDEEAISSESDFKINAVLLDDLLPASIGFSGDTLSMKENTEAREFPSKDQREEEEQAEGTDNDYQSDFESESQPVRSNSSNCQVSEHLLQEEEEEEAPSEDAASAGVSCGRTEDDYSSMFSDRSSSSHTRCSSQTTHSSTRRSHRSSGSSGSHSRAAATATTTTIRHTLRDAAVQTHHQPLVHAWSTSAPPLGPEMSVPYLNPSPLLTQAVSAQRLDALSTFNPAVYALNEILKQQLAMTKRYIEDLHHMHSSLVQSLEPPNYRYVTLEDTQEYIRQHRRPKLTREDALKEVLQEMKMEEELATSFAL